MSTIELDKLPQQHQKLLLLLPHLLTRLVAGADGQIDQWEHILSLEAINNFETIHPEFMEWKKRKQVEDQSMGRQLTDFDQKNEHPLKNLGWMLKQLEAYPEMMDTLPEEVQANIRNYVKTTIYSIAGASDEGKLSDISERIIGASEYAYMTMIMLAFDITPISCSDQNESGPYSNSGRKEAGALLKIEA